MVEQETVDIETLCIEASLDPLDVCGWVERGWVRPVRDEVGFRFRRIDVARVHMIADFRHVCGIEDESIPVLLSLIDQFHDLRAGMRAMARAVEAQPEEVRHRIFDALDRELRLR